MKRIFTFLFMLLMTTHFFAQSHNIKPKYQIAEAKHSGNSFKEVSLFSLNNQKSNTTIPKEFKEYSILTLRSSAMRSFELSAPEAMNFSLPRKKSSMLLELVKIEITTDNFSIVEMPSGKIIEPETNIAHYRGIVKNSPNSIVALTILNGEVSGIITLDDEVGNLVLGKLDKSPYHILYEDKDISHLNDFVCKTEDIHTKKTEKKDFSNEAPAANQVKCPEIFFDIGNDVVRDKGGSQAASNFVQAMFNQVALLYANDDVKIKLSGINAWTSTTPFNSLDGFRSYRNQNGFNGDLAHFVTYNYSGGVAWLNALCGSYRYGLSGINRNYENVPRYSWNISTIAHELGHNFGLNHTHSCSWNNNNTAIDGCYNTEGNCSRPGIPSNGGTIMSYCHLTSVGTNLRKGFGPQPRNVIQRAINRASCIGTCDGDGGDGGDEVSCAGIDEWSSNVNYVAGDKVTYRGRLFERTANNAWKDLGKCSTDPCSLAVPWVENTTYFPGDVVIYNGNVWLRTENNDWEYVDCDNDTTDPCSNIAPWAAGINYEAGEQVVFEGKVFEWNGVEWIEIATCAGTPASSPRVHASQIIKNSNILIYPNPAKDFVTLEIKNVNGKNTFITVKDMQGKKITTRSINATSPVSSIKETFDIQSLKSGIYFLQIINSDGIVSQKIHIK